jgi:phage FluMu protein Com
MPSDGYDREDLHARLREVGDLNPVQTANSLRELYCTQCEELVRIVSGPIEGHVELRCSCKKVDEDAEAPASWRWEDE